MDMIKSGIDISAWQGAFDLAGAKAEGFDFVIIKGGGGDDGLYTDSKFVRNYDLAKSLGMDVGAYWFSRALSVDAAIQEADYFYEHCLKGRRFELPVYMDVENKKQLALGKRLLTDVIHAFCQRLEERGFWVGVYSSQSYFSSYMLDEELQRYAHWVACWAKSCSYSGDCFGVWQYGGGTNLIRSNKVAGVVCDQNHLLIDYPALVKQAGKNGYGGETPGPEAPAEPAPAPEVPDTASLSAGMKLTLSGAALYGSATAGERAAVKTGVYYLWDADVINGRVRITNTAANAGKAGQVTGWIALADAKAAEAPAGTVYTVRAGDTLWDIAAAHLGSGARYREIMARNGLTSATIYAGQRLTLPDR